MQNKTKQKTLAVHSGPLSRPIWLIAARPARASLGTEHSVPQLKEGQFVNAPMRETERVGCGFKGAEN